MAMASSHVHLTIVAALVVHIGVSPPTAAMAPGAEAPPVPPLAERLHHAFSVSLYALLDDAGGQDGGGGSGMMECWGALMGLQSCTSEIVLFFVNGESYIGPECCRAIRGATRHCWPSMLASVGFTAQEADVLQGFCDAEAAGAGGQANAPPARGHAPAPGKP